MTKTNQILHCSSCNASVEAACDCGVPYITAAEAAKRAVAKHPEKSDRAIAEEVGVGKDTVRRARQSTGGANAPPAKRVGRDGKSQSATKRKTQQPQLDRAREAVRERVRASQPINSNKIAKEIGVSHVTVDTAVAAERGFVEGAQEAAALDLSQHSPSARERIERTIAMLKRTQADEVKREVHRVIVEWMDEVIGPTIRQEINELTEALNTRRGDMTVAEYKLVERCLHPDNSASPEKRAEAFDFWRSTKTKIRMLDNTQFKVAVPEAPTTRAGWEALKKKVAEKKAARKAANAVAKDLN